MQGGALGLPTPGPHRFPAGGDCRAAASPEAEAVDARRGAGWGGSGVGVGGEGGWSGVWGFGSGKTGVWTP